MSELQSLITQLTSGEDEQAEAAAGKIAALGDQALLPLSALLADPDPDTRWWAVRTLAALDNSRVASLLHQSLKDADPSVKQAAALGLCLHPARAAIPDLIAALDSEDRLLARLAAQALAATGKAAVPALLEVMENGTPAARLEAIKSLATIKDPRAVGVFFQAIRDGDSALIEYWADEGLNRLGVGMKFFKP